MKSPLTSLGWLTAIVLAVGIGAAALSIPRCADAQEPTPAFALVTGHSADAPLATVLAVDAGTPSIQQAAPAPASSDPSVIAQDLAKAIAGGKPMVALGCVLLLLAWGVGYLLKDANPVPVSPVEKVRVFLHTDLGTYLATAVIAFAGTYGTALFASGPITIQTLYAAFSLAGGVTLVFAIGRELYAYVSARSNGHLPPGHPGISPTPTA